MEKLGFVKLKIDRILAVSGRVFRNEGSVAGKKIGLDHNVEEGSHFLSILKHWKYAPGGEHLENDVAVHDGSFLILSSWYPRRFLLTQSFHMRDKAILAYSSNISLDDSYVFKHE